MTAPLVSVLVPAWNAGRSITRALDSVLADATVAVQVVVVDDASTDDTTAVVEAIAARDSRVELVRSPANGGPSVARNLGLPRLRGDWITFLDADDRLLPGALEALLRAALATDALAVVGQRVWSDGVHRWISSAYDRPDIRVPGRKSVLTHPGLLFYASGTGKLFHRSVTGGLAFEGRVLGDQPWTIRALLRAGDRIEVIGDDVYEWTRPTPGSTDSSITSRKHDSAALAAEAVVVAIGAFREVYGEARQLLPPDDADRVGRGYLERLMQSDFSGPIVRALESRDPAIGELFEACLAFVRSVPPSLLEGTASVRRLVVPPVFWWDRMTPRAQAAYRALLDALPPGAASAAFTGNGPVRDLSLRVLRASPPVVRAAAAALIQAAVLSARRLTRHRHRHAIH